MELVLIPTVTPVYDHLSGTRVMPLPLIQLSVQSSCCPCRVFAVWIHMLYGIVTAWTNVAVQ